MYFNSFWKVFPFVLKHSNQSQQSWTKTKKLHIFQCLPHKITVVFRLGRGFVERKIEWRAERFSWLSQSEVRYNKSKVTKKLNGTFLHFLLLAWSFPVIWTQSREGDIRSCFSFFNSKNGLSLFKTYITNDSLRFFPESFHYNHK